MAECPNVQVGPLHYLSTSMQANDEDTHDVVKHSVKLLVLQSPAANQHCISCRFMCLFVVVSLYSMYAYISAQIFVRHCLAALLSLRLLFSLLSCCRLLSKAPCLCTCKYLSAASCLLRCCCCCNTVGQGGRAGCGQGCPEGGRHPAPDVSYLL